MGIEPYQIFVTISSDTDRLLTTELANQKSSKLISLLIIMYYVSTNFSNQKAVVVKVIL